MKWWKHKPDWSVRKPEGEEKKIPGIENSEVGLWREDQAVAGLLFSIKET